EEGRRKKEEGRRKKEEGRNKEEGPSASLRVKRRNKEEGIVLDARVVRNWFFYEKSFAGTRRLSNKTGFFGLDAFKSEEKGRSRKH
ncbi:hypothetical protein QT970_24050, partial [Microcoleus sp. herbarium8]|uniref:hypothetical protein n=1 Tax=Microcoleus sp. herbarium8 TaxID=3055436 RepID=UPI002FD505A3